MRWRKVNYTLPPGGSKARNEPSGRGTMVVECAASETMMRFEISTVVDDAEAVARSIARELNLRYEFIPRAATGSGMKNIL